MAQQIINNGESGATVRGKINANFTELYTGKDAVTVNTFADLPAASSVPGQRYWVLTTTGVYLINRRQAGAYYSDGTNWTWLGDVPTTADQIGNVPAGAIASTNLQAAINELDADLTGAINNMPTTVRSQIESALVAGANITITPSGSGPTRQFTIANSFGSQSANTFLAAPNGTSGAPTFRAIVAADIPTLNQNTTGSAATLAASRSIAMTGDVAWSVTFNGSANVTAAGTIANDAVSNAKLANMATATFKGRASSGTGDPEDLTAAQVRTLINVADGATANSTDAALRDRATHTGTQTASTISDFATSSRAQTEAMLVAGANVTLTPSGSGATRQITISATGSGGGGSGDVVGPASSTDDGLAAFNGATGKLLKSGTLTLAQVVALLAEVVAARGSRSALALRIDTISNFASPNAGGVIVGQYYDNAFHSAGTSSAGGAAGRFDLSPFYTSVPLRIDEMGVSVTTGVAGALGRCCIYGSDANGWPDQLLFEGPSNLDLSSTGYKAHSIDFLFDSGRQYWLGAIQSSTATLRAVPTSSAVNLGVGSNAATYFNVLRRTLTYADPLPANYGFIASDRFASTNGAGPSIRMRAAAL